MVQLKNASSLLFVVIFVIWDAKLTVQRELKLFVILLLRCEKIPIPHSFKNRAFCLMENECQRA
jgi:hypothetical protein